MNETMLALADLTIDPAIQPRQAGIDNAHVKTLTENGPASWPPVQVIQRDDAMVLVDGHHRYHAALLLELAEIAVEVVSMPDDGDLHGLSFTLNKAHGMPLSNADRQAEAVRLLQNGGAVRSNNDLARRCGLSDKTVGKLRSQLEATSEIPKLDARAGADGKRRPATRTKQRDKPSANVAGPTMGLTIGRSSSETTHAATDDLTALRKITAALVDMLDALGWTDDRAVNDLADALVSAVQGRRDAADLQHAALLLDIATQAYRAAAKRIEPASPDAVEGVAA